MFGLGTIINTVAIVAAGFVGMLFGKAVNERHQSTLTTACGVSVIFVGISGALEGMIRVNDGAVVSANSMLVVICIVFGALIGEICNFEDLFEKFGEWLKRKTGNAKDAKFVDAFVTASFTVCIGAMAIVGSIEDGISGDYTILATKSILDFIIIVVMTSTMGKGAMFSAIPVFVLQGCVTLLATVIEPVLTDAAMANLSMVGSILIFCVGVNLVWGKKVRVANFLPAILLAVFAAYLPVA